MIFNERFLLLLFLSQIVTCKFYLIKLNGTSFLVTKMGYLLNLVCQSVTVSLTASNLVFPSLTSVEA